MNDPAIPRHALAPGAEVPRILNGCWQLAQDHHRDPRAEEESIEDLLHLARQGFTTFDAADIYTGVEERLGAMRRRWQAAGRESSALRVHTKFVPDRDVLENIDPAYVRQILDRSRHRLGTECLDLVQFHWWDFEVEGWVETARCLDDLRQEGTLRHLGVTNFDQAHLRPIVDAGVELASNQVQYSLLDRRPERGTAEFCIQHGISLLTYGALAGGFLTERWLGADDPGMEVENRSLVKYRLIIDEFGGWQAFQNLLRALGEIARKHGVGLAQVAIRWVLGRPGVGAVILGARTAAHGERNVGIFRFGLDSEDEQRLDALLAKHPGPPGDIYSVERLPGGRHGAIMKTHLNQEP